MLKNITNQSDTLILASLKIVTLQYDTTSRTPVQLPAGPVVEQSSVWNSLQFQHSVCQSYVDLIIFFQRISLISPFILVVRLLGNQPPWRIRFCTFFWYCSGLSTFGVLCRVLLQCLQAATMLWHWLVPPSPLG